MTEGGERAPPIPREVTAGPLTFTAQVCPNPWYQGAELLLRVDERGGWSRVIVDPAQPWDGYIQAKPSYGPMEMRTHRLPGAVAVELRFGGVGAGVGGQEIVALGDDGRALGAPLEASLGHVRIEDGALMASSSRRRTSPAYVGALQRHWRLTDGAWVESPPTPWTMTPTWPCEAITVPLLDGDGAPTGETAVIGRGARLEVRGYAPLAGGGAVWSIAVDDVVSRMANPTQGCQG